MLPMSDSNPLPQSLNYAPPRRRWIRRISPRILISISLIIATAIATRRWGPAVRDYIELLSQGRAALQQCLNHTAPPSQVVFDEATPKWPAQDLFVPPDGDQYGSRLFRTTRAQSPTTAPVAVTSTMARWDCNSWPGYLYSLDRISDSLAGRVKCVSGLRNLYITVPTTASQAAEGENQALVFMHRLHTPAGRERLVLLTFDGPSFVWRSENPFRAQAADTGFSFRRLPSVWLKTVNFPFSPKDTRPLRLFAGQPDPLDPTHFTIPYDLGGDPGTIDGWLQNDDSIKLLLRDGPAKP